MNRLTRLLVAMIAGTLVAFAPAATAFADDDGTARGSEKNESTAINTEDGASVFRFAFSIQKVTDGVIDQTNTAVARASCTDCATVSLAFQVVLVSGNANVVTPENRAEAVNVECSECLTYAAATQIVIGIDGKELTKNGERRLKELEKRMREIEKNADQMTDAELLKAAQDAEAELIAIFNEELVPIEPKDDKGDDGADDDTSSSTTTSSTSTTQRSTTTTTERPTTTTSEAA